MKVYLERIQLRVTREEKANAIAKAAKKGMKLSGWLRSVMRAK